MLEVDGAIKRFGDFVALDACTFSARPGRLTGFLGPNGAGKTTAMRAVFGLVALDRGTVRWRGLAVGRDERLRFGYMPEERGLYPRMAVGDQLRYLAELGGASRSDARRNVDVWLARFELADRAGDRLDTLSHGNQQRVQLAAALVTAPELLVLDEPFSGLDPVALTAMSELLRELAGSGVTVLFSSHQLDLVEDLCDDVVIVDHGRVVLDGELVALRAAAPERWVTLRHHGPSPDWSAVPGVEVAASAGGEVRLRLDRSTDPDAVLAAARRAGEVLAFTYAPPTLTELFHQAVAR